MVQPCATKSADVEHAKTTFASHFDITLEANSKSVIGSRPSANPVKVEVTAVATVPEGLCA